MSLWRKVVSALVALVGAIFGVLLTVRRRTGALSPTDRRQANQEYLDKLEASMSANQQAGIAEAEEQRELALEAARLDSAIAQVDDHVEGLSHDDLDASLHGALSGPAGSAVPAVVKPGRVIKPAN